MTAARSLSILLLLCALTACGHSESTGPPSSGPTTSTTTTTTTLSGGNGLLPSDPALTDRIELDSTRVEAGRTIRGALVVVNRGTAAINLTTSCRPEFVVALTNSRYVPQVAFAAVCSAAPFMIAPGTNRFPIQVATTYLGCSQKGPTGALPRCSAGGPPPLPVGSYDTVLVGSGLALPEPRPVPVTLTAGTTQPVGA